MAGPLILFPLPRLIRSLVDILRWARRVKQRSDVFENAHVCEWLDITDHHAYQLSYLCPQQWLGQWREEFDVGGVGFLEVLDYCHALRDDRDGRGVFVVWITIVGVDAERGDGGGGVDGMDEGGEVLLAFMEADEFVNQGDVFVMRCDADAGCALVFCQNTSPRYAGRCIVVFPPDSGLGFMYDFLSGHTREVRRRLKNLQMSRRMCTECTCSAGMTSWLRSPEVGGGGPESEVSDYTLILVAERL